MDGCGARAEARMVLEPGAFHVLAGKPSATFHVDAGHQSATTGGR